MVAFQKFIAALLAFLNVFLISIGLRKTEVIPMPNEKTEITLSDKSTSNLLYSAEFAKNAENDVQAYYTGSDRTAYKIVNSVMSLTHKLKDTRTATLRSPDGGVYIGDSFRTFYTNKTGIKNYFESSLETGRVNTIRLGLYYYDVHVRDFSSGKFKVDKTFHTYSDRLYAQYDLLASEPTTKVNEFGSEIKIPENTVDKICIKDRNGYSSSIVTDAKTTEFVAFDIKDVGVVGFIVPSDGSTKSMTVEKSGKNYVVTQLANYVPFSGLNDNEEQGGYELNKISFGARIYTDRTHSFDGIKKAAEEERNPLDITVSSGNSNASYLGYDALRGAYTLTMDGAGFQWAYDNADYQYAAPVSIENPGDTRTIFVRCYGKIGCLEAAALLDENNTVSPIQVEVCKNFQGDGGEGFYSPIDYQYGDSFFPLVINAGEKLDFTLLNLYQNWGKTPLKQLSSIEFHTSYYHLSTGCTESNCIAPYFVGNKDGFFLPDFRCRSGNIWSGQPQFNSTGILKFMVHRDDYANKEYLSEYSGGRIDSVGRAYSDITNAFTDDAGKYTYTLRHVEMPQTDENRTYYTLKVDFTDDVTYENFRENFDLFYQDGRFCTYSNISYLNTNNMPVYDKINQSGKAVYHVLGTDCPFFGINHIVTNSGGDVFGCNFALLIKDSKIIVGGEEKAIPFVFRDTSKSDFTQFALTLDAKELSFKKGDSIEINMILLPWGTGDETNVKNAMTVREDSCKKPVTITADKGEVIPDAFVPTVRADSGEAEFTLSGGRNNIAVAVTGLERAAKPEIYKITSSGEEVFEIASEHGYDGYTVTIADDGTYTISFVYTAENPDTEYTFRVIGG